LAAVTLPALIFTPFIDLYRLTLNNLIFEAY